MLSRSFVPAGFSVNVGAKDVRLAILASESKNVAVPSAYLVLQHLMEALAKGNGHYDWASLIEIVEHHAGKN